jgi:cob(I)alamin adenosyltransferase
MKTGYVQIYTGDGKGKTTAALGLALRAAGHGLRTYFCQFMKGQPYGELNALHDNPSITIEQFGRPDCIRREDVTADDIARAHRALDCARQAMLSGDYDIVVLDEVNVALWFELLALEQVLAFLAARPPGVELVLTGRRAPAELMAEADLVTEMKEVKHYYSRGVVSRDGIER